MDGLGDYERRFRRAGLPLFIDDYSAREDVWTRVTPVLALVFLGQLLGAIDRDWSTAENLAALAGGLAFVAAVWVLTNRLRGRLPLARPEGVGQVELSLFVLVPALLPLIFGGQVTSALVTAGSNLLLLTVLYAVVGYGVLAIVSFAARRVGVQLASAATLLARAVPLLLLFAFVLFVNTEAWQVFADMDDLRLLAVSGLFAGVGTLFLAVRLPREVKALEAQVGKGPPLDRRQRVNVGLVLFISQALQVVVVALAVFAFFVAFGALAIDAAVVEAWLGHGPDVMTSFLGGDISRELLRVAAAISAFSGLYYAIAVLTDSTYRAEFVDELTDEMRTTFADRAEYLRLREASAASARPAR